jgi:hypothetical protein
LPERERAKTIIDWRYQMLSFARDIRPMFTKVDVEHMLDATYNHLDLSKYESVKGRADTIYSMVSFGAMPPDNPWPKEQVATFKQWMDEGCPP